MSSWVAASLGKTKVSHRAVCSKTRPFFVHMQCGGTCGGGAFASTGRLAKEMFAAVPIPCRLGESRSSERVWRQYDRRVSDEGGAAKGAGVESTKVCAVPEMKLWVSVLVRHVQSNCCQRKISPD